MKLQARTHADVCFWNSICSALERFICNDFHFTFWYLVQIDVENLEINLI